MADGLAGLSTAISSVLIGIAPGEANAAQVALNTNATSAVLIAALRIQIDEPWNLILLNSRSLTET